jgi:hypothetical protein
MPYVAEFTATAIIVAIGASWFMRRRNTGGQEGQAGATEARRESESSATAPTSRPFVISGSAVSGNTIELYMTPESQTEPKHKVRLSVHVHEKDDEDVRLRAEGYQREAAIRAEAHRQEAIRAVKADWVATYGESAAEEDDDDLDPYDLLEPDPPSRHRRPGP